jgi:hypothetical protein
MLLIPQVVPFASRNIVAEMDKGGSRRAPSLIDAE